MQHKGFTGKVHCSKGIGSNYINRYDSKKNKYNNEKTDESYRTPQGFKLNLPIYYRNKIYSEEERQNLWINKLDKGERYVCGEKVQDESEEYYKLLEHYRKVNKQLGYGDDSDTWKVKEYKESRIKLKQANKLKEIIKDEELNKILHKLATEIKPNKDF